MEIGGNKRFPSPLNLSNNSDNCPKKQRVQVDCEADSTTQEMENYDFLFSDDDDFNIPTDSKKSEIDLKNWSRCVVTDVQREKKTYQLILKLSGEDNPKEEAELRLQGPWSQTKVTAKDLVSVLAVWDDSLRCYKIDKDNGFIVTNPDTLISGTSVVGSLFCQRKGVLQDRFRGIDGSNKIMVIGSLVHEILQTVLGQSLKTREDIKNVALKILEDQQTAFTLYECKMTLREAKLEVQKFFDNILNFIEQYVEGKQPEILQKDLFQEKIDEIKDIEENLWIPQLGLKGKVDVSVKIHRNSSRNLLPLELKTGRASFSLEHKGQLILYQMMLTAAGRHTDSGLLLYLREGIMKEIHGTRNEHRDLIMLRNELSYYLTRYLDVSNGKLEEYLASTVQAMGTCELPEPISHPSACGKCAYATICCAFGKTDPNFVLSERHPLKKVSAETTEHLSEADLNYFTKWCGLLSLEEKEAKKSNFLRSIWKDSPEVRQQHGRAIIGLRLKKVEGLHEGRYLHCFNVEAGHNENLISSVVSMGEYVIVSSPKRIAIAAGFVYDISLCTITINLERNLEKNYKGEAFIVDKHESQSEQVFNYTNLGILLEKTESSTRLRQSIIQQVPPKVLPIDTNLFCVAERLLIPLNPPQRRAVFASITTDSFQLIKGLPGTGKTQTLVALIRILQKTGNSVIITSHTHSAVDNILLRLSEGDSGLKILRLGSETRIHPRLRQYSERVLAAQSYNEEELAKMYSSFDIVAVTCLGAGHPIFTHRKFDFCIVDEATQVLQPTVLRPLFFASKFILVGDPNQLPPLVRSREARALGADESLFERLDGDYQYTVELTLQYRMNKTITKLANEFTYNGKLECSNDTVSNAVMKLLQPIYDRKWQRRALQSHIDQAVVFIDTLDCLERSNLFARNSTEENLSEEDLKRSLQTFKYTNYCEAAVIFDLVGVLLISGFDATRIGIIAPYRAQVDLLKKVSLALDEPADDLRFSNVEVNTVDQYQGRDKDVIFYSCTRTGSGSCKSVEKTKGVEILEDKRRLTVAITRSKHKLIIVGDSVCLKQYTPFEELLQKIPSPNKLTLSEGRNGFVWGTVLRGIQGVLQET